MLKLFLSYLNNPSHPFLLGIILFFSPSVATAGYESVKIAQQPQKIISSDIKASADKYFTEAEKLLQKGTEESLKQAISKFQQALKLYRQAGEKPSEAHTLLYIADIYDNLGQPQKGLELYQQVLPLIRSIGDKKSEANTLSYIGDIYASLQQQQKALEYYNQALPLIRATSDRKAEAYTLGYIGDIYASLQQQQQALDYYNQVLSLIRLAGDKREEIHTLYKIGLVYDSVGEKRKALEYYNQALPIIRVVGDKGLERKTLNNIGLVYDSVGEKQKALEFYNQALLLIRSVKDKNSEAYTLNNIGAVYDSLGEKQKALDFYNQALPLFQEVGDNNSEAFTLNNIGLLYNSLGEKRKALQFYNQALLLIRKIEDRVGEGNTFNNIGAVYFSIGEKQKALEYYNQALILIKKVGDKGVEGNTLNNIGLVYFALGEKQKALYFYNQALPLIRKVGDKSVEGNTLNNIGSVYFALGEKQKALDFYNQALYIYRTVKDRSGEAITLYQLANLKRDEGNLKEALIQMQSAINIIEDLRTKITSQELRTSYFATFQDYYKFYIDILMELHKQQPSKRYDALALQVSESARARSLLELISESNADIRTGVDTKLLQTEKKIKQKLNAQEKRRVQLLSGTYTPETLQVIETEIKNLLDQYQDIQTQIRSNSPRYAAITQPQPLSLAEIQQQVLDENTLLLEYSLGKDKSYLWAVSKTDISSYELPKSAEIEKLVENFRKDIFRHSDFISKKAEKLTKILLEPVTKKLGNKRLVIVGDGALQYLPFAALSTPNKQEYQPLIVNHEIVSLPSASTVALLRTQKKERQTASKTIAILADPVFTKDDPRLTDKTKPTKKNTDSIENLALNRAADNTNINFIRLPFTRIEAEIILKLVPNNQSLQAYDFDANRNFITNNQLNEYRILHFATHGILDSKQPELSGLVLSLFNQKGQPENGFLRLHDVFNLNLAADLVVLSACNTGLGQEIKGEGVVGLTTGFIYAGSPRVVMSLWSVKDDATAVLMQKFYQKMLKEGFKPAAALRQAQIEMFNNERFSAPDFWAAFTLQGEWR
jgi:CHAT domain-containing protein/tetratricopeptide (TPR) repeat protein